MAKTLIEFTDHGQDFLWWVVDEGGKVIECGPYQADIWCRLKVTNLATLKVGGVVEHSWDGRTGNIKYPVLSIQPLTPVEVSVRTDSYGYITATVRRKRASCTSSPDEAVKRLAEKLFPGHSTTIERLPCTAFGRLHSKWRIAPARAI